MTKRATVGDVVIAEIREMLNLNAADITPQSRLIDLGAQSFDFVELILRLEKQFDVSLPKELMIPDSHTVARYIDEIVAATRDR